MKDGAPLVLFDGQGGEYPGQLVVQGKRAQARLDEFDPREAELGGALTLVQGLPSADKMDWVIEKAVEMGVARVVPIAADRSVVQLTGERREKRLAHWRRIAESASEQCGRNRIMQVEAPVSLAQWLATPVQGMRLMCHPAAAHTLRSALSGRPSHIALIVGPEGGWSDAEMASARQSVETLTTVRWGDRVLRTETAGIALAAACATLLDWV